MSRFATPDEGNTKRPGSPANAAKNLQRKINRQARDRLSAAALEGARP